MIKKIIGKLFLNPKISFFLMVIVLTLSLSPDKSVLIPITGSTCEKNPYFTSPNASKLAFISQVMNGNAEQVTGLWLPNLTGLVVQEQPAGQPGFVTDQPGTVTNFQLAADYGSMGLLAHVYLAGAFFNTLDVNHIITIVYGDGSMDKYRVTEIRQYQALDPDNTLTDFTSIDNWGKKISQEDLFYEVYSHPGRLILQTCIVNNNDNLWGRKFIIAEKAK
jgi:hypothetical protein